MSENEWEEELTDPSRRPWPLYGALIVVAALVVTGIGSIGHFSGVGWFGYRQVLYGIGELYVLNLNDEQRYISVNGAESALIEAQNAQIVELVGGNSRVQILDDSGNELHVFELSVKQSHAFINISEEACLAVTDVTPFYGQGSDKSLKFVDLLAADKQVYIPQTYNVIWPRQDFPAQLQRASESAVWIELVGCPLLNEHDFLDAYLGLRLQERMQRRR